MERRSRLSGSLPLSIAAHFVALAVIILIPIVADLDSLPVPFWMPQPYIAALAAPPPPVVRVAPTAPARVPDVAPRDYVPLTAPDRIAPETDRPDALMPDLPLGETAGTPGDLGAIGERASTLSVITPPPVQKSPTTVRVSELVQPPRKTVDVRPNYPEVARIARIQGPVVLEAILDRTGRVDHLRIVQSIPLLDQAALDAVRQWRYAPSVLNGQPVAVLMTVTIRFTLQ